MKKKKIARKKQSKYIKVIIADGMHFYRPPTPPPKVRSSFVCAPSFE